MLTRAGQKGPAAEQQEATPEPFSGDSGETQSVALRDSAGRASNAASPGDSKPSSPAHAPGAVLGPYVVLEHIASGGMGEVYKAHDPRLDRQIALKLLSVPPGQSRDLSKHRDRLVREAQALAQLSHPNVVAVHDVGTVGDHVFVAMELVAGVSVRAWLRDDTRSPAEIVRVFLEAGRGLAAAHRAGLIHRDVKPSNIMFGDDGRVKVVDFGLARGASDDTDLFSGDSSVEVTADVELSGGHSQLDTPLTAVGAIVGTPRFMAPEQRQGLPVDARADQFSFCVSLYEALTGARLRSKFEVLEQSDIDTAVAQSPRRFRKIFRRGLALEPYERYPSMDALLVDLERDPKVMRRRLGAALATVAILAVSALTVAERGARAERCQLSESETLALWNPTVESAIGTSFTGAASSHGADTAARVSAMLRERADAWAVMHKASCEATWVQGTQSEALLDLRTECLGERRAEQLGLMALLSQPDLDASIVSRAVEAASSLPAIARCADTKALRSTRLPPPNAVKKVTELRDRLATVRVRRLAGDYELASADGEKLVSAARELGYAPLLGEASYEYGMALRGKAAYADARTAFEEAVVAGGAGHDFHTASLAAAEWMWVVGYGLSRGDDALLTIPAARALASQVPDDAEVQVTLLAHEGTALVAAGDFPRAHDQYERALELAVRAWGKDDLRSVKVQGNLAMAAAYLGDYATAAAAYERESQLKRRLLGPDHPDVGKVMTNIGFVYRGLGRPDEALASCRESLRIFEAAHGSNHLNVLPPLNCLVKANIALDDLAAAAAAGERSLSICDSQLEPGHLTAGKSAYTLAEVYLAQEKNEPALELFRRATASFEPDQPYLVSSLAGSAKALAALGRHEEAAVDLERAVAFASERELPSLTRVQTALVQLLWDAGERKRSRAEAQKALATLAAAGKQSEHDKLAAWLAERK